MCVCVCVCVCVIYIYVPFAIGTHLGGSVYRTHLLNVGIFIKGVSEAVEVSPLLMIICYPKLN